MKNQSSKNLKLIFILLALSSEAFSANETKPIIPKSSAHYDEKQKSPSNALYGAAIDSCQTISDSWKNNSRTIDFQQYMNIQLAKAAKKAEERLFEEGAQEEIENFYYSKNDKYKEYITAFEKNQVPQEEESDGSTYPEPRRFKGFVDNRHSAYSAYVEAGNDALEKIEECIALHTVITKGPANREMDFSDYNKSQTAQSYDGKLKCSSVGYETQDYKACSDATTFYDAVFLGRTAVETVQSFQYMDSSMDIQTEMAQNSQTDATAGLKAQQQDIQVKANMARTRAATETAAVGALWVAMEKIPELESLYQECESSIEADMYKSAYATVSNLYIENVKALETSLQITTNKASIDLDANLEKRRLAACNQYIYNTGGGANHALIQNSGARQIIQQALIDSGVNIATMLGTAEIYDKQASRVGDAIKLVDDYDPESLAYDSEDLLATECQVNPNSENCVSAQYERGVDYHNDGISVNGMQFATSDSTLPIDEYERNTDAATDNTNRTNTIGGIGSTVDPVDKGGGLADSPIGAASVSSTGSNGLGSGGGGRGGGGGGASAPANGSASTGGQGGSSPYVGTSKKLSYSSGGGLSFSSGSKRTASKTKAENPFSKLFGKKDAKSNGVLNFRGVASDVGTKNGSIFQMISKRYSAVSKDKRLEEYQKVNE
ncbi:hypothetical protein [Halobacteriovorax sp.]|uniref:hypothetical protein n=1 Tax=Halobacteriovorax sp. TaxID=2020862 RepID=UPI00356517CD